MEDRRMQNKRHTFGWLSHIPRSPKQSLITHKLHKNGVIQGHTINHHHSQNPCLLFRQDIPMLHSHEQWASRSTSPFSRINNTFFTRLSSTRLVAMVHHSDPVVLHLRHHDHDTLPWFVLNQLSNEKTDNKNLPNNTWTFLNLLNKAFKY